LDPIHRPGAGPWSFEGPAGDPGFAEWCAPAGDVNQDGYADILICWNGNGTPTRPGGLLVFHGGPDGLSPRPNWQGNPPSGWEQQWFCSVAEGVGDVDADGFDDVLAASNANRDVPGEPRDGVFLFHGSAGGLESLPRWNRRVPYVAGGAVVALGRAGDLNADGYADFFVALRPETGSRLWRVAVCVFFGGPHGPGAAPGWTEKFAAPSPENRVRVAGAGDVNGDGCDDLVVGDMYWGEPLGTGRVLVHHGSKQGLSHAPDWVATYEPGRSRVVGGPHLQRFGWSVAGAGDVDGDGCGDLLVGAPYAERDDLDEGLVFLYHGSRQGLEAVPRRVFEGNRTTALLGWGLAGVGDLNRDGFADVVLGAPQLELKAQDQGGIAVFLGAKRGLQPAAHWSFVGTGGLFVGKNLYGAGDVNGDGYADLLAGEKSPVAASTQPARAVVWPGGAGGLAGSAHWRLEKPLGARLAQFHERTPMAWKWAGFGAVLLAGGGFFIAWRRALARLRRQEREAAQVRERERLARDVHDELGASLSQIALWSQVALDRDTSDPPRREPLERIALSARDALDRMGDWLRSVDPAHAPLEAFAGQVTTCAQRYLEPVALRLVVDIPGELPAVALNAEVRTHLVVMLKEALRNVVEHARATTVTLRLRAEDGELTLTLTDDGCGFTPNGATRPAPNGSPRGRGHGLRNLHARAQALGGRLEVRSRPGGGTTLDVRVPLGSDLQPSREERH
jgi:signal transduction histidine kinase